MEERCSGVGNPSPNTPQGLGINRGFLHALDCADLASGFAALVARREAALGGAGGEEAAAAAEHARREGAQLLRRPNPYPYPYPLPPIPTPTPYPYPYPYRYPCPGAALLRRREEVFGCTKRVSGSNRLTELKKPVDKQQRLAYKIDPATRYINLPIDLTPLLLAPN